MALFGRKKEEQVDYSNLPEEMKPHLALKQTPPVQQQPQMQQTQPQVEMQEPQFDYATDLLKMGSEQTNVPYPQFEQPQASAPVAKTLPMPKQVVQMPQMREEKIPEKATFAPLFVKIDRYRNILKSLGELKTTLSLMRNSFAVLDQMEQLKIENMKLIMNALDKVEKKLIALDAEFLRPSGFHDEMSEQYEAESLQGVVSDLQSQIQQLKSEINRTQ